MSLLSVIIYLSCFMVSLVKGKEFKQYCYDPPGLTCAEKHILDCPEGEVITTDISNLNVSFLKKRNSPPECKTKTNECKNKTYCCQYINQEQASKQEIIPFSEDEAPLIKFIKTECSSKSSCIVSSREYFNNQRNSDLYDYVTYHYGCINASKDAITVDFLVNESTKFTGNRFPTIHYLDYTGSGSKEDNDVILNRECIVTTTEKDISLTIKSLNLQADDCCLFHISGHKVSDYCSQNGSVIPPKGRHIGSNTATIRLENVVKKDGDSFSILVKAAGNVTIDCREIQHDSKQDNITVDYLVNGSTKFTGNNFQTVYYLDYTGNGTKQDNETILNRECIVTSTEDGIALVINELNFQAHDCCRFHISGNNVPDYCSQNGSFISNKGRCYGRTTSTISLENVVNKDGDSFSILVRAAGNVTIDCREIQHTSKQEPNHCQNPALESNTKSNSMKDSETNLAGIIGGTVGGLVVLVVIIIVVVVIMRRRRRPKSKVDENNYRTIVNNNPEDNPNGNSKFAYIDIDLDKDYGYSTVPNNNATQVKGSGDKENKENKDAKERGVPNEKANPKRKRESEAAHYSSIDELLIKPLDKPSASAAKDSGQQGAPPQYSQVKKKHGKFIIPANDKDDAYDHAKQMSESLNQKDKEEQNASDTYDHKNERCVQGS